MSARTSEAILLACHGLWVPVPEGRGSCLLPQFLQEVLRLDPAYTEQRIQTILLNGFAVDNMPDAIIKEGSRLALSAALPGVVGATLRRGGHYAPMRSSITLVKGETAPEDAPRAPFWVELRCFNAIAADLGPRLIALGVAAHPSNLGPALRALDQPFPKHLPPLPQPELLWIQSQE